MEFRSRADVLPRVPWIETRSADICFALAIVANAAVLGVETEVALQNDGESHGLLFATRLAFYLFFVLELILRIREEGSQHFFRLASCKPIRGAGSANWKGLIDVFVVLSSTLELLVLVFSGNRYEGGNFILVILRVAQLLRIVRLLCFIRSCPGFGILGSSMVSSLRFIFWAVVFLFVLLYIGSLICAVALGLQTCEDCDEENETATIDNCCSQESLLLRRYFGSLGDSFYTHLMLLTLDGYPAISKAAGEISWVWYLYIAAFIIFANLLLLSFVIAVVAERTGHVGRQWESNILLTSPDEDEFEELFLVACSNSGFRLDQDLKSAEFATLLRSPRIREILDSVRICVCVDEAELFCILDVDCRGALTVHEICEGLRRLRGTKDRIQSLLAQGDIVRSKQKLDQRIEHLRDDMRHHSSQVVNSVNEHLASKLLALPEKLTQLTLKGSLGSAVENDPSDIGHESLDYFQLSQALAAIEFESSQAGQMLAKLHEELAASRARVRHLESKVRIRSVSVQTKEIISISDRWNAHRDNVAQPMLIVRPKHYFPPPDPPSKESNEVKSPVIRGLSEAVDQLLDENSRKRKDEYIPIKRKDEVILVAASHLPELGRIGKPNPYCICKVRGKRPAKFQTDAAFSTSSPEWHQTHEFDEQLTEDDTLDFHILHKESSESRDRFLCVASLPSRYFLPHGFHGKIQLAPLELHRVKTNPAALEVKVRINGGALKQANVLPPLQFPNLSDTAKDTSWVRNPCRLNESLGDPSKTPSLVDTPKVSARKFVFDATAKKRFRAHSCSAGKTHALDATRTPSSSDQEESASSRDRRKPPGSVDRTSRNLRKKMRSPISALASPLSSRRRAQRM